MRPCHISEIREPSTGVVWPYPVSSSTLASKTLLKFRGRDTRILSSDTTNSTSRKMIAFHVNQCDFASADDIFSKMYPSSLHHKLSVYLKYSLAIRAGRHEAGKQDSPSLELHGVAHMIKRLKRLIRWQIFKETPTLFYVDVYPKRCAMGRNGRLRHYSNKS